MLFRASEVAYYTYMFANIRNKDEYQIATSIVRTSVLVGKCSCGTIAQILISYNIVSYVYLLYLSVFGEYNFYTIIYNFYIVLKY